MLKQFENRWWVVVGSFLGLIVSAAPMATNTIGTFVKPISGDLGWTRAQVTLGLAISGFAMAVGSVILGRLMDRYGVRPVTLLCVIGFGLVIGSIGFANSLTSFTLLYIISGFVGAGIAPLPYAKSISGLFDRQRGLALGVAISGVGLGTALLPQFAQVLVGSVGWRGAYIGMGLLHIAVAFPAVLFLIREPESGQPPVRSGVRRATVPGKTVGEALRDPAFWLITIPFVITGAALVGFNGSLVPLLSDGGMSVGMATTAVSVAGIAAIFGRIFSGYLLDRMFAPYVTILFLMIPALGIVALGAGQSFGLPFAAAFLIGLGIGGELDLMAFLLSRYFGLRAFGTLYGLVTGLFYAGVRLGPFVINYAYEHTGSYTAVVVGGAIVMPLGSFLISRLGPYVYPVVHAPAGEPLVEGANP